MLPSAAGRDRAASENHASSIPERIEQLKQKWPCREQLIEQLGRSITRSGSTGAPVFVFGPPATGKTAIVRDVFRELAARHAYVNCQEVSKTKLLLSSILHQLKGSKRRREDGYDCSIKCDSIAEFLHLLPAVVASGRRAAAQAAPCWVVLDHVQRLAGSELLTVLMKMRATAGANVGLVLVSGVPWSSGRYFRDTANVVQPAAVFVPGYTPQQLQKIMDHRRQQEQGATPKDAMAYRQFLEQLVPPLCRATNNLLDVQAAVSLLYPRYQEHQRRLLKEGRQPQATTLFKHIKGDMGHVISTLELHDGALEKRQKARTDSAPSTSAAAAGAGGALSSHGLAFELPYVSKYLLAAAYIASHNKPTTDRQVFDSSYVRRGRKDAQAADRAAEAALEARLKGPHSFPLERLLHIFYALYQQQDEGEDAGEEAGEGQGRAHGPGQEAWQEMQQGEVLMQLATLVSLRLLSQSSGDVLEGVLYRCNLSEDMAHAITANIKLRLQDYLKMG